MQVLIADELPDICIEILEKAGLKVLNKPGIKADELKATIGTCDGIILRSGTKITAALMEKVDKLKAIMTRSSLLKLPLNIAYILRKISKNYSRRPII